MIRIACTCLILIVATGCRPGPSSGLPGTIEWDRIAILAEASEPVVEWLVSEGDRVERDQLLLRLDATRFDARIAEASGRLAEAEAFRDELVAGPRQQVIDKTRAELRSARAALVEAEIEFDRVSELERRRLTAAASLDQARANRDRASATVEAGEAALDELLAGTRQERVVQAEARVSALRAELAELRLTRQRLEVRAPRAGRVDSLPFKPGDQPHAGDPVASLLVGVPYARVFVPVPVRATLTEGARFNVTVEGIPDALEARVRSIRSDAAFTPYYALTGDDASRLVYRAELAFDGDRAATLPAGLPLLATRAAASRD